MHGEGRGWNKIGIKKKKICTTERNFYIVYYVPYYSW